jgi:ribosomal protein S18 acetylase RimI-like enzyme
MLTLRLAERGDIKAIFGMYDNAIYDLTTKGINQWDAAYPDHRLLCRDISNRWMHILTDHANIVSAVVINRQTDELYQTAVWSEGEFVVLHRLCVHPLYQNKGIGKKTALLAEEMLKEQGIRFIRLDAYIQNPASIRLYESLGYRRVGTVFFRKGEFILFEKQISGSF